MRGAAGVLDALVGEPIMAGQGKAADLWRETGICGYVRPHGAASWQGRRLAAVIPSGFPRLPAAGAWGGPRRAAGSIRGAAAPPGAGARPAGDHALPVSGPAHPASCALLRAARDLTCPSRSA